MKNAVSMHVIYGLKKLKHVELDSVFREILPSPLDSIIHIHVHELEHHRQTSSWLITTGFVSYYRFTIRPLWAWLCLDAVIIFWEPVFLLSHWPTDLLSKYTYLINILIVTLHAFDGNIFAGFDALSLEDLTKGSLSFLADQSIFYKNRYINSHN